MIPLVLDTNVLVSGTLRPDGPPGRIIDRIVQGDLIVCYNDAILREYREVMARPRFDFDPDYVAALLEQIRADGMPVEAAALTLELPDPTDEPFVTVAAAAQACLVTGNAKHYPAERCRGVEVLAPAEFLRRYPGDNPTES